MKEHLKLAVIQPNEKVLDIQDSELDELNTNLDEFLDCLPITKVDAMNVQIASSEGVLNALLNDNTDELNSEANPTSLEIDSEQIFHNNGHDKAGVFEADSTKLQDTQYLVDEKTMDVLGYETSSESTQLNEKSAQGPVMENVLVLLGQKEKCTSPEKTQCYSRDIAENLQSGDEEFDSNKCNSESLQTVNQNPIEVKQQSKCPDEMDCQLKPISEQLEIKFADLKFDSEKSNNEALKIVIQNRAEVEQQSKNTAKMKCQLKQFAEQLERKIVDVNTAGVKCNNEALQIVNQNLMTVEQQIKDANEMKSQLYQFTENLERKIVDVKFDSKKSNNEVLKLVNQNRTEVEQQSKDINDMKYQLKNMTEHIQRSIVNVNTAGDKFKNEFLQIVEQNRTAIIRQTKDIESIDTLKRKYEQCESDNNELRKNVSQLRDEITKIQNNVELLYRKDTELNNSFKSGGSALLNADRVSQKINKSTMLSSSTDDRVDFTTAPENHFVGDAEFDSCDENEDKTVLKMHQPNYCTRPQNDKTTKANKFHTLNEIDYRVKMISGKLNYIRTTVMQNVVMEHMKHQILPNEQTNIQNCSKSIYEIHNSMNSILSNSSTFINALIEHTAKGNNKSFALPTNLNTNQVCQEFQELAKMSKVIEDAVLTIVKKFP